MVARFVRGLGSRLHLEWPAVCRAYPSAAELFGMLILFCRTSRGRRKTLLWRGHGPQRQVREFAVGALVVHGAQHDFVRRLALAHHVFHNGPRCGGFNDGAHADNVGVFCQMY